MLRSPKSRAPPIFVIRIRAPHNIKISHSRQVASPFLSFFVETQVRSSLSPIFLKTFQISLFYCCLLFKHGVCCCMLWWMLSAVRTLSIILTVESCKQRLQYIYYVCQRSFPGNPLPCGC